MLFLDEPTVRRILTPILDNEATPISLLTHAHPLNTNPYVFAERWIDTYGNTYLIDTEHILRAMDTPPRRYHNTWPSRAEERHGILRLRMRAETLAKKIIPNFENIRAHLHPFESHFQKSLYTFRWERAGEFANNEHIPALSLTFDTYLNLTRMENSLATSQQRSLLLRKPLHRTNELFTAIEFMEEHAKTRTTWREQYHITR